MTITILGSGCPKCLLLEQNAKKAIEELGLNDKIEVKHIFEIDQIIEMGITFTPALMIDGQIKSEGKVLSVEEIKELIKQNKEN